MLLKLSFLKPRLPIHPFLFIIGVFPDCQGANISSRDGGYGSRPIRYPSPTPHLTTGVGKTPGPEKKKDGMLTVKK